VTFLSDRCGVVWRRILLFVGRSLESNLRGGDVTIHFHESGENIVLLQFQLVYKFSIVSDYFKLLN
jgi:hypothetical protein